MPANITIYCLDEITDYFDFERLCTDLMAFLKSASITAGERDGAVRKIRVRYGWDLDMYGGERLRVPLEDQFPHVRHRHPAIFAPALLAYETARRAGTRDRLHICCAPEGGPRY